MVRWWLPSAFDARCRQHLGQTDSVGVALIEADITTTSQLLERADKALYQSKTTGRNRVTFWHEMQPENQ
ncbi:diguanylate cyclase domain-containing protein [Permianibacter aggregans]